MRRTLESPDAQAQNATPAYDPLSRTSHVASNTGNAIFSCAWHVGKMKCLMNNTHDHRRSLEIKYFTEEENLDRVFEEEVSNR